MQYKKLLNRISNILHTHVYTKINMNQYHTFKISKSIYTQKTIHIHNLEIRDAIESNKMRLTYQIRSRGLREIVRDREREREFGGGFIVGEKLLSGLFKAVLVN